MLIFVILNKLITGMKKTKRVQVKEDTYVQRDDGLQEGSNVGHCFHPDRTINTIKQIGRCIGSISPVTHKSHSIHGQHSHRELKVQSFHHVLNNRLFHGRLLQTKKTS